jgi:hypothetical protein
MIAQETKQNITDPEIDCSITFVQKLIDKVADKKAQTHFNCELKYLIQVAQNKTYDRSYAFLNIKELLLDLFTSVPEIAERQCSDAGIPERIFEEPVDRTTEEQTKLDEDKKAATAEFYKKTKKKPKTEDEETNAWEEIKGKIEEELKPEWDKKLEGIERELEKKEILHRMNNYEKMDYSKYETLSRKKSIYDETIQDNILVLRLDLDAELTPTEYEEFEEPIEAKGI